MLFLTGNGIEKLENYKEIIMVKIKKIKNVI